MAFSITLLIELQKVPKASNLTLYYICRCILSQTRNQCPAALDLAVSGISIIYADPVTVLLSYVRSWTYSQTLLRKLQSRKITDMGNEKTKPRQPFTEFFQLHHKVTHKVMEENSMSEEEYTQFLVTQIAKFFNSEHEYFKDGMQKYVVKNSKSIYKCYQQFLKDNCMADNWSTSCINPSSLEEEFYKYIVEFYQCSLQFSITKEDYLSIIDDVHSFMKFLSLIKKSVVKPKLWTKQTKEPEIEPISNSVEDLLFTIGKKVYSQELNNIKDWMSINRQTQTLEASQLQASKDALKYLNAFQKTVNTYAKKQKWLVKLFQNLKAQNHEQQPILKYGISKLSSQQVFIQLLILSRLGSHQASRLLAIIEREVPVNLKINQ